MSDTIQTYFFINENLRMFRQKKLSRVIQDFIKGIKEDTLFGHRTKLVKFVKKREVFFTK